MKQMRACADWIEKISADVDGELSLPERKQVSQHLADCADCRATRDAFLHDRARFATAFDAATSQVSLTKRVFERIPRRPPRRGWGIRLRTLEPPRPGWAWAGVGAAVMLLGVVVTGVFTRDHKSPGSAMRSERMVAAEAMPGAEVPGESRSRMAPATKPPVHVEEKMAMAAKELPEEAEAGTALAGAAGGMMAGSAPVQPKSSLEALSPPLAPLPADSPGPTYEATLHLRVAHAPTALTQAERLVEEYGGRTTQSLYPAPLKAERPSAAAELTCRVRPDKFWALMQELGELGKMLSRQVNGEPVEVRSPLPQPTSPAVPWKGRNPAAPSPAGKEKAAAEKKASPPPEPSLATITVYFRETDRHSSASKR